jgi:hypothetical protein
MIRALTVALLVVAGCKKRRPETIERMDAFVADMCACKDRECAESVHSALTAWSKAQPEAPRRADQSDVVKLTAIMARYTKCYEAMTRVPDGHAVIRVELPPDVTGELFVDDKYLATVKAGHEISVPAGIRDVAFASTSGRCDARLELIATKTTTLACTPGAGDSDPALVLPVVTAPFVVDSSIRQIAEHAAQHKAGAVPIAIEVDYVRADGTLDPKYGALRVDTGIPDRPLEDDPDRPIGAPVPTVQPNRSADVDCPQYTLDAATARWTMTRGACGFDGDAGPVRCGMTQIWDRARRDGAPAAALAKLALGAERASGWTFQIEDAPRGIHFAKQYGDDCEPVLERIDGGDVTATGLDRPMIVAAMAPVKERVRACSARSTARGTIRARVEVASTGRVREVEIVASPDPKLSSCVRAALQQLAFPATRGGGSFTYPFVF